MRLPSTTGIVLASVATLVLAGCGGSDNSGGGPAGAPVTTSVDDRMLRWAQCMREQGVNVPDPGQSPAAGADTDGGKDDAKMTAAKEACRQHAPQQDLKQENPQAMDDALKLAQCLRARGYDVPDPQPDRAIAPRVNSDPVKFKSDTNECLAQMGKGKPGVHGSSPAGAPR
ncbi:hypothetical protein [Plantactinospora soyae]|uniref:Secreted protein n=1 Tax=Plantactinospora soyae TaxID=1544732 RepID=A0A927MCG0_9ACTN|nr:hypothetical protein [Plantactinospora soyae]MBE1491060.1 hypothetical protein [Plantactinospora soyae]